MTMTLSIIQHHLRVSFMINHRFSDLFFVVVLAPDEFELMIACCLISLILKRFSLFLLHFLAICPVDHDHRPVLLENCKFASFRYPSPLYLFISMTNRFIALK